MQLTNTIYRNGFLITLAFTGIFVWGFWPTFYAHPFSLKTNMHYVHALAVSLWFVLLITQPLLIRMNCRSLHRSIGKLSFVIVPIIVISSLLLVQYRQHLMTEVGDYEYGFLYLISESTVIFSIFFALAIFYKETSAIHARYMISTVFPLLPAATDRLLGRSFPENALTAMYTGWVVADLIVLALLIWDWRSHKKLNVFPLVLGVMIFHHIAWFYVGKVPAWRHFSDWFAALQPLYVS